MSRQHAPSAEAQFWSWFAANSDDLLAVRTAREPVVQQLSERLHDLAAGLCFEFGPTVDGRREFIVSADGNKELFAAVKRLVALAPDLPGWLVIAFRPPKPVEGQTLRYGDVELSGDDVWFTAQGGGARIDLELFIRGLDEDEPEPLAAPAFILLDATLGEFVVETRVGSIGWHALPDDPAAEGLRPFAELPSAVALPIRRPVSLLDALDEPGEPPAGLPRDPERDEERWTLMEVRRGDEVTIVGVREDLEDRTPPLDHEALVRVTFRDPSDEGLPDEEEMAVARRYGDWITARLQARCPAEPAVHLTGDGARDLYLYCSDPAAAVAAWEEVQPAVGSHQVAFYVRHSPDWEVLRGLLAQRESVWRQAPELAEAAHEFLAESLAESRDLLEEMPGLWLPVHLFAFGAARAVAEAEDLSRDDMLSHAYTLFVRCLRVPADEASAAMHWIIEHESEEATEAVIAEGEEAFTAWHEGEGGTDRLGELLAQMRQANQSEDNE